jgi:hypothetical protein
MARTGITKPEGFRSSGKPDGGTWTPQIVQLLSNGN